MTASKLYVSYSSTSLLTYFPFLAMFSGKYCTIQGLHNGNDFSHYAMKISSTLQILHNQMAPIYPQHNPLDSTINGSLVFW